jgi:hypothetical protein
MGKGWERKLLAAPITDPNYTSSLFDIGFECGIQVFNLTNRIFGERPQPVGTTLRHAGFRGTMEKLEY